MVLYKEVRLFAVLVFCVPQLLALRISITESVSWYLPFTNVHLCI